MDLRGEREDPRGTQSSQGDGEEFGSEDQEGDPFYAKAMELVSIDRPDMYAVLSDWDELPLCQELPPDQWDTVLNRANGSNRALEEAEAFLFSLFEDTESGAFFPIIDHVISRPDIPQSLGLPPREFNIALLHTCFRIFAAEYEQVPPEARPEYRAGMAYIGVLHDLLLGARTGLHFYMGDPEKRGLALTDEVNLVFDGFSPAELKRRATAHLFEGERVTYIQEENHPDSASPLTWYIATPNREG